MGKPQENRPRMVGFPHLRSFAPDVFFWGDMLQSTAVILIDHKR